MLCELCQNNLATVHLKQVVNGEVRELHACEECAEREGLELQSESLTDFLFGLGAEPAAEPAAPPPADGKTEDKVCPACQMRQSDFKQTSRLGCPECYNTFKATILPLVASMHRGAEKHSGRAPDGVRTIEELEELRAKLDKAVSDQDFEGAAVIRDAIKTIQVSREKGVPSVD